MSVVNGKLRDGKPRDRLQPDGRHPQDLLDRYQRLERLHRGKDIVGIADDPEHHFCLRLRRNDVWRHTAADQANAVGRRAEDWIVRQRHVAQLHQRIEKFLDCGFKVLRRGRVAGATASVEPDAKDPARAGRHHAVGRLAVDQEPRTRRRMVRQRRALAPSLLADDEQQANASITRRTQTLGGRHLRREDALGVARTTPVEHATVAAGNERRHAS